MIARPVVWVDEFATQFWAVVGELLPFPRDLRRAISLLPNLRFREIPNLTLHNAAEHFRRWRIPFPSSCTEVDRPLRGCFGGHSETALILIDANDAEDEKRFTVAHELAHYFRDFDEPRRKAAARLGPKVLEVFDGLRPPSIEERLAGVLRGVTIGCHTHFLDRDRWGCSITAGAFEAEEAADRLAYELLAPFDSVNAIAPRDRDSLATRLTSDFGFPSVEAAKYSAILFC